VPADRTARPGSPRARAGALVRRIGEHARSPGAAPDRTAQDGVLWGLAQVVRAVRLLAADRALLRAALVPTALTFLGSAALAAIVARDAKARYFQAAFASFVAVSSMPPTILWRQWQRVGLEARRALCASPGEEEHPGESFLRRVVRELWKAVLQAAAVSAGIAPVVVVVEILPFIGHGVTVVLGVLWAWYWVVLDALEIPTEVIPGKLGPGEDTWFERALAGLGRRSRWLFPARLAARFLGFLARPWRHEAAFTELHPWPSAGFALAAGAFLAIPVVGVFFRAVAITAATILVVRLDLPPSSVAPAYPPDRST